MKRIITCASVLMVALLATGGSVFGSITVGEEYVTVSMTIDVVEKSCSNMIAEYDYAWTDATPCDRPGPIDEKVFGLTYTHLKIIRADNQCLLLNGRIDPAVFGERDLVMNIPIGVPITESNVTFGPGSDFTDFDIYSPRADETPLTLERESSYRIEITEQVRTCDTRQTAEAVLDWAVVDIPASCCVGIRGNVDGQGGVNIADINYLLGWLFRGGPPPPCMAEADADGSGDTDIDDAMYLLNYLFGGGPLPVACP